MGTRWGTPLEGIASRDMIEPLRHGLVRHADGQPTINNGLTLMALSVSTAQGYATMTNTNGSNPFAGTRGPRKG